MNASRAHGGAARRSQEAGHSLELSIEADATRGSRASSLFPSLSSCPRLGGIHLSPGLESSGSIQVGKIVFALSLHAIDVHDHLGAAEKGRLVRGNWASA